MTSRFSATLLLFFSAFVASALTSCVRCVDVRLFNNTGESVTVVGITTTGEKRTWKIEKGDNALVWYQYRWEIVRGTTTWTYGPGKISYPGREYAEGGYFGCLHAAAQIDPNGGVWMLAADAQGVVDIPPAQPPGYPAMPEEAPGVPRQ